MKERYDNLDGIRAYLCIGVIFIHILANGYIGLRGFVFGRFIGSIANPVFLFMTISSFSMCCGYYEQFKEGTVDINRFYIRRYERIWPFFAILCTLELLIDHSLTSLYEWFADLTLSFGLLPNADISVVGVGWFLGVIFVFYMIFPFYVFLIINKKRAWMVMGISIIMNALCEIYFFNDTHVVETYSASNSFIYCLMFFVAGGLIYLYRDSIRTSLSKYRWGVMIAAVVSVVFYYTVSDSVYTMIVLFTLFTILGIMNGGGISMVLFQNKTVRFIGSLSMEIYLCHMFVYRTLEKCGVVHITGSEIVNYVIVCLATICGAVIFAYMGKKILQRILMRKA